jgi:septal ring factor EnvC (AmiA/AmiB activator)
MTREANKPPLATVSDDEYESEEDMSRPYEIQPATTTPFVPTRPSPIFSLPSFSGTDKTKDDIIEHMRQEIANLRRTSAEAVSTSLRLSEQLSNAHCEVARSHEFVNQLEETLQDELMKRRDAERQREVEAERRRAAEQALSNMAIRPPSTTRIRPG